MKIDKAREALREAISVQDGLTEKMDILDKELATLKGKREAALIATVDGTTGDQKTLDGINRDLEIMKQRREGLQLLEDKAADRVRITRAELAEVEREEQEAVSAHIAKREAEYQAHLTSRAADRVRTMAESLAALQTEYGEIFTEALRNEALSQELFLLRTYHIEALESGGRRFAQIGGGFAGPLIQFEAVTSHPTIGESHEFAANHRATQYQSEFHGQK
jgi:hypothetical protein